MKNVTFTMEDIADWARMEAARRSARELLAQKMRHDGTDKDGVRVVAPL